VIPNDRDVAGLGAMVLNPFKGAEDCRSSQRKYRQVPGLLSGAVDTSAGVVLTHPLPGGFVAPTRDGEAGGCQTVISNSDLTGRNDRMLARAVHRGGIPGSTQSNQEAQGKNRGKNRAHDGRFQSSAARYVFGSAVDHPKLRVLHDRSIRRDNFVMPDHPTGKEALLRYRFTPYAPRTSGWPATRSPRGAQGGGEGFR
jgi:hypothetical protein